MANSQRSELLKKIELGIRLGAARALKEHKQAGRCIYIWKDGRVVAVPPEEIQVDEALLAANEKLLQK